MVNEAIILTGVALVANTCGEEKNGDYPGIKDSDTAGLSAYSVGLVLI